MKFSAAAFAAFLVLGTGVFGMAAEGQNAGIAGGAAVAAASRALAAEKKKAEEAADQRVRQEEIEEAAHPLPADPKATLVVHDGDPITLHVVEDLSSKKAKRGTPVPMALMEDLKVGDVVVAKAGSHAMGEVVWVSKAAFMGNAGSIELRLDYLKVGQRKVWLRGSQEKYASSAGRQAAAVVGTLTVGVGFFIRGKDMVITPVMPIKAYIGDDVALPPAEETLAATAPGAGV